MIAGVAGNAEAGVAGIVYNVTKELRKLGHTVKPMFFDDLLPKTRWPRRFRTFEFAAAIAEYVSGVKNDFDVINVLPEGASVDSASARGSTCWTSVYHDHAWS